MSHRRRTTVVSILLACTVLATGCATKMKLQYAEPPAREPTKGEISVVIEDSRPADQGGEEPMRVGSVRNQFGMPFPLMAASDRDPLRVTRELVVDCLEGTGYRAVEPGEGVPELNVGVLAFWTDGYQHSRVVVALDLQLRREGVTTWREEMIADTGLDWTAGYGQFDRGYTRTLDLAKMLLIGKLDGDEFEAAYAAAAR